MAGKLTLESVPFEIENLLYWNFLLCYLEVHWEMMLSHF